MRAKSKHGIRSWHVFRCGAVRAWDPQIVGEPNSSCGMTGALLDAASALAMLTGGTLRT